MNRSEQDAMDRDCFRSCYARFRYCTEGGGFLRGYRSVEFMCDFHLACKRALNPAEWRIFSAHYLLGADWVLCTRQLGIPCQTHNDKKNFFEACYRIEAKLGRVFRDLQPFALWTCNEYFCEKQRGAKIAPTPVKDAEPSYRPLRPPLAQRQPRTPANVAVMPAPAPVLPAPVCLPPAKRVRPTIAERRALIRARLAEAA